MVESTATRPNPIRILPDDLAARIAAGEVIERPASVVKELVENSLDAGASRIDIEVWEGGRTGIRVADDGAGISEDQLPLAFERFATSKIDTGSDLVEIATLGFRGEALPSIASVAIVEVTSKPEDATAGTRRLLEFGRVRTQERTGRPRGTTVHVRELFRNVPARLKFLGAQSTELGRIHQVVAAYALTRPDVAFRLWADDARRLVTSGSGDLLDAIGSVYGPSVASHALRLAEPQAPGGEAERAFRVAGAAMAPAASRGNRNYITFSANGRWIQNRQLAVAVEGAYHGFLPDRRFPIAVLDIRVPTGDLDVNVHPAKAEVRFLRDRVVFSEVQRAVRAALLEASPVPDVNRMRVADWRGPAPRPAGGLVANPLWPDPWAGTPFQDSGSAGAAGEAGSASPGAAWTREFASATPRETGEGDAPASESLTHRQALPVMRVIGQVHESYIVAEGPDGVYLVDQHAAHERVMFEEIRRRFREHAVESQHLLDPLVQELHPHQEVALSAHGETLARLGYIVEPFGPSTVILRAVPGVLSGSPIADAFLGLLDSLEAGGSADDWQEHLISAMACRAAVTAGTKMSEEASRELVRDLEIAVQPHTCPHGRPTMIHLSATALEREFKRR